MEKEGEVWKGHVDGGQCPQTPLAEHKQEHSYRIYEKGQDVQNQLFYQQQRDGQ
jgi:hypothetical protein